MISRRPVFHSANAVNTSNKAKKEMNVTPTALGASTNGIGLSRSNKVPMAMKKSFDSNAPNTIPVTDGK